MNSREPRCSPAPAARRSPEGRCVLRRERAATTRRAQGPSPWWAWKGRQLRQTPRPERKLWPSRSSRTGDLFGRRRGRWVVHRVPSDDSLRLSACNRCCC